ncbi:MAG: TonB-dependent receptor [Halioglobus sp.]
MKTVTTCAACVTAALTTSHSAASETSPVQQTLEEIVVTSSRVPTPLRQIGTSVSVVTQLDIERLGYSSLYDVLRTQPGIGVSNQGGPGSITSLRIRGEESYRTRYYLDGIDISDTSSPQNTGRAEHILSSGVQRVEILRGPQGLMYGADAGGVVNISTLAPSEGFNGSLSAEAGRYDTQQYAASLNGGNGTVDFSLTATDYASDLFNARTSDTDLLDEDGYENTTLHGRLGWNLNDALRLSLVARDVEGDNDYDECFTVDTFLLSNDCRDEFEQQSWRVAANYQRGRFAHEIFYSDNDTSRDNFTENRFAFGAGGDLQRSGYLGSFEGGEALKLVYGVDLLSESSDGASGEDRDQQGYYLEYQGGFNDSVYFTAGARYDDNDDFGSHTSFRVSGAYLVPLGAGEMKVRASYGTGFRPPSLFEIDTNSSAFTLPPAQGLELSEEESVGYDLAVSWTDGARLLLEAVYFDQEITDEIFYDFDSFGYLQRSGDTQSQGIELFAQWDVMEAISLNANYTYTDSQDIEGNQRPRRPEHLANLGLSWQLLAERLVLGVQARLSQDAVNTDGSALDDYEVLDVNATFRVTDGLEVYGRIENLLDEDYEEVPTYNTSGAAGYIGLRYHFGSGSR